MRLVLALALSGAGLAFGLIFDLFGRRRTRPAPVASTSAPATEGLHATQEPGESLRPRAGRGAVEPREAMDFSPPATPKPSDGHTPERVFPMMVGGLDGCRKGWVMVITSVDEPGPGLVSMVSDIEEVVALVDAGQLVAVAVDIPIGLPGIGPRLCDVEARKLLGPRRSSVFPAPVRAVVGSSSYAEACARSRAACGRALSKQTYVILPKVEAVDEVMTPERQAKVVEVHPEVSFTLLAGHPMAHHKATAGGRAERLAALRTVFTDVDERAEELFAGTQPDDILDAFVAAWSARRWVMGSCRRLGGELDERSFRMEIIA
ncbi:MAG TPA: DUF429 domain-containing protein [Acidimicrobiales bacterium]|nr:DUF429 domain-containing protein [Acidimicrobiales bacterium]